MSGSGDYVRPFLLLGIVVEKDQVMVTPVATRFRTADLDCPARSLGFGCLEHVES